MAFAIFADFSDVGIGGYLSKEQQQQQKQTDVATLPGPPQASNEPHSATLPMSDSEVVYTLSAVQLLPVMMGLEYYWEYVPCLSSMQHCLCCYVVLSCLMCAKSKA